MASRRVLLPLCLVLLGVALLAHGAAFAGCAAPMSMLRVKAGHTTALTGAAALPVETSVVTALVDKPDPGWWIPFLPPLFVVTVTPLILFIYFQMQDND
mmetsp:Transcript_71700/g.165804  ORF Transcript_71700/g.165804 Transcript_71700/m.165804 type:complete len:99 (+) Transcript_71700:99-395(+)